MGFFSSWSWASRPSQVVSYIPHGFKYIVVIPIGVYNLRTRNCRFTYIHIYMYIFPLAYLTFPFGYLINISNLVRQKVNFNPPSLAPRIICYHSLFSSVHLNKWHHSPPRYWSQKSDHSFSVSLLVYIHHHVLAVLPPKYI